MGRLEKAFVIFSFIYIAAYSIFFFNEIKAPGNFETIIPFHFLGMALGLGLIIVVVRDVFKRNFSNPNSKIFWTLAIIMFWPSALLYLPMYGFKTRDVVHESGNNKKIIIGFVLIIVLLFGFAGYSMYTTFKSFEKYEQTIDALAASGKDDEILAKIRSGSFSGKDLSGDGNSLPLHSAAGNNRPSTVKILIEHGAKINQQENCNGDTPLHEAARKGYYEVVKVLLAAGADKTILNSKNKTACDLARENKYPATAELLSM